MYSRSLASLLFIAVAFLLTTLTPSAYALPAEPGRTVGQVVAENKNMACRMYACFNKNATNSTGDAVAAADAAANSTDTPAPPAAPAANGASSFYQYGAILPAIVAGSSLLLLV